ncbi:membrane protein [Catellatospora sp. TT07R-123]|uniref:DUF2306 domain-containing protein n=1 Tax=Catellatospora sp. TT07R-123 TaxID=2733863 RepID=UPI001B149EB6|nr:DUF2306 domain-containing protein [Catellatospora sp. TT07R-123]GHJ47872.1 membrane protein [Catellatospora sp. TT07R-123]
MTTSPPRPRKRQWPVPTGLVLLTLVPAAGGASRIAQLLGGAEVTQENARFFDAPVPVLVHIVTATAFCLLGAFQFVPRLRQRRTGWHRAAGRIAAPLGLLVALSGLWMTVWYPDAPGDGLPLRVMRLVVGTLMAAAIVLGFAAARRRDFRAHGVWMMRGYAIGQGAGTQVFTHVPWLLLVGVPSGWTRAMLMAAGWLVNMAVVEWYVHRRRTRRPLVPAAEPAPVRG